MEIGTRGEKGSKVRRRLAMTVISGLSFFPGCATMTPEARLNGEIYWEAAKACESRHRTLHVDRIDPDGSVTMHADAESRQDLQAFTECYRKGVRAGAEKRRQAGLPVPETLNQEPTAEID
jgi:hypothetical protein